MGYRKSDKSVIEITVKAKACFFHAVPVRQRLIVVCPDDKVFDEKYSYDCTRAIGINLEDETCDNFYLVYVDDCFSPPLAIVRANSVSDAEAYFVDEVDWAHLNEIDAKDYDEETLHYSDSGIPYDSESIMIYEATLLRVEC